MRKAASGIMLTLLLMSMLTWAFGAQPSETSEPEKTLLVDDSAFTKNETDYNKKGNGEQARIVEHRITAFELEKLKLLIGVLEEDGNHRLVINGHGRK